MKQFYYIRHGETDWNKQGIWQGHYALTDSPDGTSNNAVPYHFVKINNNWSYKEC